jgi:integrase
MSPTIPTTPLPHMLMVRGRAARALMPAPLTIAAGRRHSAETILRAWRENKSANTIRGYEHDLEDFSLYFSRALGLTPPLKTPAALDRLFGQSSPSAHEIVLGFRTWMEHAHLSAASINRHLATLRSVSKLARMLGLMTWYLEVPGVRGEKRRQTAGPTLDQIRQLLAATSGEGEGQTRDYALITTFVCLALRVEELCNLNLDETDLDHGTTWIKGKGRREKELVPLPPMVIAALRRYLVYRGHTAGPLFQTRGHRGVHRNGRLETRSVLRIVRELGQRVGLHLWCHALRHSSITIAIQEGQRAGLGIDQIRWFSRHRSLATLLVYRDEHDRTQTQRTLADLVAATLHDGRKSDDDNRVR